MRVTRKTLGAHAFHAIHSRERTRLHPRARTYQPAQGRWLSVDPLGYDESDLYEYTGNSPLKIIDPSGLAPIICACRCGHPHSRRTKLVASDCLGLPAACCTSACAQTKYPEGGSHNKCNWGGGWSTPPRTPRRQPDMLTCCTLHGWKSIKGLNRTALALLVTCGASCAAAGPGWWPCVKACSRFSGGGLLGVRVLEFFKAYWGCMKEAGFGAGPCGCK